MYTVCQWTMLFPFYKTNQAPAANIYSSCNSELKRSQSHESDCFVCMPWGQTVVKSSEFISNLRHKVMLKQTPICPIIKLGNQGMDVKGNMNNITYVEDDIWEISNKSNYLLSTTYWSFDKCYVHTSLVFDLTQEKKAKSGIVPICLIVSMESARKLTRLSTGHDLWCGDGVLSQQKQNKCREPYRNLIHHQHVLYLCLERDKASNMYSSYLSSCLFEQLFKMTECFCELNTDKTVHCS